MFPSNYPIERIPKGYQQLTVADEAIGLTVPAGATRAVIKVIAQPVRFRNDGTNPTTTVGYPLVATEVIELTSQGLSEAKFIRSTGSSATLEVLYYGSQ